MAPVDDSTPEQDQTEGGTVDLLDPPPEAADPEDSQDADQRGPTPASAPAFGLLFQAPDLTDLPPRPTRRRAVAAPPADETDTVSGADGGAGDEGDAETDRPTRGRSASRSGKRGRGRSQEEGTESPGAESGDNDPGTEQADAGSSSDGRRGPEASSQDDDGDDGGSGKRRRRRGGKGRRGRGAAGDGDDSGDSGDTDSGDTDSGDTGSGARGRQESAPDDDGDDDGSGSRRRRRRSRSGEAGERRTKDEVSGVKGSVRLEAKRQRRREGREAGRRRTIITEAEFLARRESVERVMVVRGLEDRTQIGVLEDGVLVEHYVSRATQTTMAGNVYLGRVQNVLPSMEAAFVDIGKGRNAVLYAGEVNWDAAGLDGAPKRIEHALKSGDPVLVQVTKDPIGHKGARLTAQVSLPGRYLVYVPNSSMTGISRKLPDTERSRLKQILKEVVPADAGVIVRTAAEGASEAELRADVERLTGLWSRIQSKQTSASAPALLHGEPDMTVRVIRDVFNEDFARLVVSGEAAWAETSDYVASVAPDLADRLERWTGEGDVFTHHRVTEALAKAMDRKVWLPSGGSLVIDRTEAMTVVDVNTGKYVGSGGDLEETVTRNNIEAAEEIVRQLRLRDIGGIIVIDFIDMVLENNRDLVVRRLLECLGRDRTKHQVAEVTSLGLVQMTRKRVGSGLIEVFSEACPHCSGRGIIVHPEPVDKSSGGESSTGSSGNGSGGGRTRGRRGRGAAAPASEPKSVLPPPNPNGPTPAQIAAAAHAAAVQAGPRAASVDDDGRPVTAEPTAPDADAEGGLPGDASVVPEPVPEPLAPVVPDPVVRPRRRRGRVSAPAGPPAGGGVAAASDENNPSEVAPDRG